MRGCARAQGLLQAGDPGLEPFLEFIAGLATFQVHEPAQPLPRVGQRCDQVRPLSTGDLGRSASRPVSSKLPRLLQVEVQAASPAQHGRFTTACFKQLRNSL